VIKGVVAVLFKHIVYTVDFVVDLAGFRYYYRSSVLFLRRKFNYI